MSSVIYFSPVEASKTADQAVPPEVPWSEGENDVVHLSGDIFDQFIQSHNSVLVMFYAPCEFTAAYIARNITRQRFLKMKRFLTSHSKICYT